jgi:hypothetical protein
LTTKKEKRTAGQNVGAYEQRLFLSTLYRFTTTNTHFQVNPPVLGRDECHSSQSFFILNLSSFIGLLDIRHEPNSDIFG